jgi:hypothetical protein
MNKKMILSLSLALMLGFGAVAQDYRILVQPAGVKEWGYSDLTGSLVIEAKYKKCIGFSEDGYAAYYDAKTKQFGFINKLGEPLATEVSDYKLIEIFGFGMKGFNGGFAAVKVGEKWGFINTEGKMAIPAKYDKVTLFNQGYASVKLGEKYMVVDLHGAEFPVDITGLADVNDFSELYASYKTEAGKVGFIDGHGAVSIDAKYQAAGDFHGGLAWAKNDAGLVGYIDTKGVWVIEAKFEAGKNYDAETGLARVKNGDKWAYVSKAGEISYMNTTDIYEDFFSGLARGKNGEKFGFYNAKMEWAIPAQFDGARDFKNGYAAVRKGELWGVIDKSGKMIIEPKFEDIKDVEVIKH